MGSAYATKTRRWGREGLTMLLVSTKLACLIAIPCVVGKLKVSSRSLRSLGLPLPTHGIAIKRDKETR